MNTIKFNFPESWKIKTGFNKDKDVVLTVETASNYVIQLEYFDKKILCGIVIKDSDWNYPLALQELVNAARAHEFLDWWVKKIKDEEAGVKKIKRLRIVRIERFSEIEKRLSKGKMVYGRLFYTENKIPHFFDISISKSKGAYKLLVEDYDARYDSANIVFEDKKYEFETLYDLKKFLEKNTPIKLEHLYYY